MTNAPSASRKTSPSQAFPKSRRLLRPSEFRQVYDNGFKVPATCFVAFCWQAPSPSEISISPGQVRDNSFDGPKVGFTAPRALGKAVKRNRMRRRVRETVRRSLSLLDSRWRIVFNLRKVALDAPQSVLDREVLKVMERCAV